MGVRSVQLLSASREPRNATAPVKSSVKSPQQPLMMACKQPGCTTLNDRQVLCPRNPDLILVYCKNLHLDLLDYFVI